MAEEGTASADSAPTPAPSGGVVQQCIDFKDGFRMTGGDWGSLTQVRYGLRNESCVCTSACTTVSVSANSLLLFHLS